ncbi:MAG: class I SAM-dependent methyltransferase [Dehalococcoidia bacterium]
MSHGIDSVAVATARANYEEWVWGSHAPAHGRRTAARNAAFFLPHLKSGMALLDAGCGVGSITLGLAAAVAPGHVTGVDLSPRSLAKARELKAEQRAENVSFEQHDLRALPFEDGTFDAVFMHAVLQHIGDPENVLREMLRLLKPGGVIGIGDADFDGALHWPDDPLLTRSHDIMAGVRPEGDARIGKRLRALLVESGYTNVVASVVGGADGAPQIVAWNGEATARRFAEEPFIAFAEAIGVSTRKEMLAISEAWRAWGRNPGAFAARFWCQAIGFKPA